MAFVNDKNFTGLQYITADNIHSPGVCAIFSTRNGGVSGQTPETKYLHSMNLALHFSHGEEDYGNPETNYKIIMASQGFDFKNLVTLKQKHTANIVTVNEAAITSSPYGFNRLPLEADALITNIKGLLLSVRTADCVPILLYDAKTQAVGAVHSGWRGTLAKIGPQTVASMAAAYGTNPKDIKAAIGPAIGQCCFEVGLDVQESFAAAHGEGINSFFTTKPGGKPHGHIKAINQALLIEAGLQPQNIETSNLCTKCNPGLFYSARYSGVKFGLQAAFIGIRH